MPEPTVKDSLDDSGMKKVGGLAKGPSSTNISILYASILVGSLYGPYPLRGGEVALGTRQTIQTKSK
jgi:hypothetical protein